MESTNINIQIRSEIKTAILTLNRPTVMNALSADFLDEIAGSLELMDRNPEIHCMILTGGPSVFAAGADIATLAEQTPTGILHMDMYGTWQRIRQVKKPVIAAVAGYALGGGCELVMLCDMIIAAENARFGQPEIKLGIIPGAGGTQRLPRLVGKHKAMEWVLTGNFIPAEEAFRTGLVNKVVPQEMLMYEAEKLAGTISAQSTVAVQMAKESILRSFSMSLEDGLLFERRNYMTCFDTESQKEAMRNFINKSKKG